MLPMAMQSGNPFSTIREFLSRLARGPQRDLSADEQTRLSWARLAKSYEEVPEAYRKFFDGLAPEQKDPFPYTVLAPTYQGFLTPQNEMLICRIGDNLFVLEKTDGRPIMTGYPLDGIFRMETGTILLHSWLTVDGKTFHGVHASTTLRFNAVTEPLPAPFVDGFRDRLCEGAADSDSEPDLAAFDQLEETHFKFMNYGRKTVRAGEKVFQVLMQPGIRKIYFRVGDLILSRQINPAHMAILTDREFIHIREDETRSGVWENPYGGTWNYVPLRQISSAWVEPGEDGTLVLSIVLPGNARLKALYQESLRTEVMELRRRMRAPAPG
jgi:hypothetical protein